MRKQSGNASTILVACYYCCCLINYYELIMQRVKKRLKLKYIFFAVLLCQGSIYAQTTNNDLPERKPLILETLLVDQGSSNGVIVTPDFPQFQNLAKKVQTAIQSATGAKLKIVADEKIANRRGELIESGPVQNTIVLGNLGTSGLIANLYFHGYCSVDANYPGKNGYVVQTVLDPWGKGVNVIILGGSNFIGIEKATERFCADVPKGATLTIPRFLKSELSGNYKTSNPSDEEIARILAKSAIEFKNGKQAGLFNPIVGAGNAYGLTGNEGQAKLFRELLLLEYDLKTNSPASFDSPWGGAADFLFAPLIRAWDKVEESPSFTDEDRRKMLKIILEYIHYYENYAYIPAFKTSILRTNHHTFPGQGFTAAGQYFMKYYPAYSEGAKWLGMGDDCFRLQQQSWKSQEDCSAYGGIAMRHMCFYATSRPDFTWFDSGRANIAGDLAIMTMDNLGYQCSFGDIAGFTSEKYGALWNTLAIVQRNGRYSWAEQKSFNASKSSAQDTLVMPVYVPPVEPVDLLGTKYMPMDSLFFATLNGKGNNLGLKRENTFDKLVFRSSFDPQRQYMALDGVNVGYHGHRDGNSVLRLSDRGRIWLADGDYIKSSPKFHNTLLIFRDGQTTSMAPFIRRDLVADLPSVGMTRTTTLDYAGTDWTRNIIWDKDRAFIFIDEVKVNGDNSYTVQAQWHTLGKPILKDNIFSVSQDKERFFIQNLDGARLRMSDDFETGKNWAGYQYADPVIHTLQQIHSSNLRKGNKIYVINVLSADTDGKIPIKAVRVNDSSLLLGSGNEQALIGVGGVKTTNMETDARLYRVSQKSIALGGARKLIVENRTIFESADLVSVEITSDSVVLSADRNTKITFHNAGRKVMLDGTQLPEDNNAIFTIDLHAGKHVISGLVLPEKFITDFPEASPVTVTHNVNAGLKKLSIKAQFIPDNPKGNQPLAVGANGIYTAGSDGTMYALSSDAKLRWKYIIGGNITAIWTGKLAKNEPERIVVGNAAGKIAVLDQSGQLIWKQQIPLYQNVQAVVYFMSADLSGNGNRSFIVGSDNWYHYAFSSTGELLWEYLSIHASSAGTAVDLDGDGKQEVIAGTQYYSWHAITPDGKKKWAINRVGPGANSVAAITPSDAGKPTVYVAGADGNIYAFDPDGNRPWTFNTGDGATCMELIDVNSDGKTDIVTGTLNSNLIALDATGKRLWRQDVGEPVLTMVQADLNGKGTREIVVGTEDGHVKAFTTNGEPFAEWATSGPVNKLVALPKGRVAAALKDGKLVVLGM